MGRERWQQALIQSFWKNPRPRNNIVGTTSKTMKSPSKRKDPSIGLTNKGEENITLTSN
jgi:hypothetical protein